MHKALTFGKPKRIRIRGELTARFYVRAYDPNTGKRWFRCTGKTSIQAAEAERRRWELAEALGEKHIEEKPLGAAVEEWIGLKGAKLTPAGLKAYRCYADSLVQFLSPSRLVKSVGPAQIEAYFRQRASEGLSGSTLNKIRKLVKQVFAWSYQRGWCEAENPVRTIEKFTEEEREIRALDDEEVTVLLSACTGKYKIGAKGHRNAGSRVGGRITKDKREWRQSKRAPAWLHPTVFLAVKTGLRYGSLAKLGWEDIDFRKRQIVIQASDVKTRSALTIPIDEETVSLLRRMKQEVEQSKMVRLTVLDLPDYASMRRAFQGAVKRAEISPMRFHDLRATFISRCGRAGIDLEVTAKLAGHKDVRTTARFYRRVEEEEKRAAIERLASKPLPQAHHKTDDAEQETATG